MQPFSGGLETLGNLSTFIYINTWNTHLFCRLTTELPALRMPQGMPRIWFNSFYPLANVWQKNLFTVYELASRFINWLQREPKRATHRGREILTCVPGRVNFFNDTYFNHSAVLVTARRSRPSTRNGRNVCHFETWLNFLLQNLLLQKSVTYIPECNTQWSLVPLPDLYAY